MLTIEVDRCNGCGACIESCPQEAISLVDGIARIDSSLCTECQACLAACPTGAIKIATPVAARREVAVTTSEERAPVTTARMGTLATLAGATLSFVGRYLLPRAADALLNALERRPSRQSGMTSSGQSASAAPGTMAGTRGVGKAGGRRRRHRGG